MHPTYNKEILYDKWLPLHVPKRTSQECEKLDGYEIMLLDSKTGCVIRSHMRGTPKELKLKTNMLLNKTSYTLTHIILASAFANIPTNETVDHIDYDYNNNNVANLRWLTLSENSSGGSTAAQAKASKRQGSSIEMVENDICVKKFISIEEAGRFIYENLTVNTTSKIGKPTTISSKIREILNGRRKCKAYGYDWRLSKEYEDLPDEMWKPYTLGVKKIQVSNLGRVKNSYGDIIEYSKRDNRNGKYGSVSCSNGPGKTTAEYVHRLVWKAFNGEIQEDKHVLHDDTAPLMPSGGYRNWLCDLKLGTRSENMTEHYKAVKENNKAIKKEPLNEILPQPQDDDSEIVIQRRTYGITPNIENLYDYEAAKITIDDYTILCDMEDVNEISKFTLQKDTRICVDGKRMLLSEYVWTKIMCETIDEGHCVKPINGFVNDIRKANLYLFKGDPKSIKLQKQILLTEKEQCELNTDVLPRWVYINNGYLHIQKHIASLKAKATKANLKYLVTPTVRDAILAFTNEDYDTINEEYRELFSTYVDIMGLV